MGLNRCRILESKWNLRGNLILIFPAHSNPSAISQMEPEIRNALGLNNSGSIFTRDTKWSKVIISGVPTGFSESNDDQVISKDELMEEVRKHKSTKKLTITQYPNWTIRPEDIRTAYGSIAFAFEDPDGSKLALILKERFSLFGCALRARAWSNKPLLQTCNAVLHMATSRPTATGNLGAPDADTTTQPTNTTKNVNCATTKRERKGHLALTRTAVVFAAKITNGTQTNAPKGLRCQLRVHSLLNDKSYLAALILMIQDPWWGRIGYDKTIDPKTINIYGTTNSPFWMCFSPPGISGPKGPSVSIYVRRDIPGLLARYSDSLPPHPNVLAVDVIYNGSLTTLVNVYIHGDNERYEEALNHLICHPYPSSHPIVIAADLESMANGILQAMTQATQDTMPQKKQGKRGSQLPGGVANAPKPSPLSVELSDAPASLTPTKCAKLPPSGTFSGTPTGTRANTGPPATNTFWRRPCHPTSAKSHRPDQQILPQSNLGKSIAEPWNSPLPQRPWHSITKEEVEAALADLSNTRTGRIWNKLPTVEMGLLLESSPHSGALQWMPHVGIPPHMPLAQHDLMHDAGLCLTHNVKAQWALGKHVSLLTMDVSGYFNNIDHARLVYTLRRLGFAHKICQWLISYLHKRTAQPKIDDTLCDPINLPAVGIPQGSPLSPILSSIYSIPLLHAIQDPQVHTYAYVDNFSILAFSHSHSANAQILKEIALSANETLQLLGLEFELPKSNLIHFISQKQQPSNAKVKILLEHRALNITPKVVVRWLGFYLDQKLNFQEHIQYMANKANAVLAGLQMLADTSLSDPIQKAQNAGIQWLTGAFKTTPTTALHHLASIPPIHIYLHRLNTNAATKFRYAHSPGGSSKNCQEKIAENANRLIDALAHKGTLVGFSDGLKEVQAGVRKVGIGYSVQWKKSEVAKFSGGIGPCANIFDAEMLALALIAQRCVRFARSHNIQKIHVFLDNLAAVRIINRTKPHPAQYASILFRKEVHAFLRDDPRRTFVVQWIPGHSKINGNKRANSHSTRLQDMGKNLGGQPSLQNRAETHPRPLSLKLHPIFNNPGLPCSVSSCLVHVMTGHGWFGEYKDRMPFIKGSHKCPCGEQVQSVPHLLFLCPLSKDSRKNLTNVAPDLNPSPSLGLPKASKRLQNSFFTPELASTNNNAGYCPTFPRLTPTPPSAHPTIPLSHLVALDPFVSLSLLLSFAVTLCFAWESVV
ncbi:Reverse transcriptase (RNA-dependent DNA polymerase) [Rhizoctonia solani]|uniref:Reverse transcriptase (RNA-dependent DNA polymerase) n=1 Tax=Rhizoctonia solani TaxID=456999 RepID=A0A8H7I8E1_9AGAM|nr:Reverse transcriptase (RNA-dependent DNA polymerase) [Rhizoctonia solani]